MWFFVALALACAGACVPHLFNRYPPLIDAAHNAAAALIWDRLHDPAWDFERYYDFHPRLMPTSAYYFLLRVLALPAGFEWANRLMIMLLGIGVPLAAYRVCKQFGRSPWLSLFTVPLVWTFNYHFGFLSFQLGFLVAVLALVELDRYCAQPSLPRGLGVGALTFLLYLCHHLPWGFFLLSAAVLVLFHAPRSPRAIAARAAVLVPGFVAGLALTLAANRLDARPGQLVFRRYSALEQLKELGYWIWQACTGRETDILAAAAAVLWLVLRITADRRRRALVEYRLEAVALGALALFLFLPRSVVAPRYWWGINVRFAVIAAFFLVLTVPDQLRGWRVWLMAPVFVIGCAFHADAAWHWKRAADFTSGFSELAQVPKPGDRVLVLVYSPDSDPSYRFPYAHAFPAYYQLMRGGFMPWNLEDGMAPTYRIRFPAPDWSKPRIKFEKQAPYWDYMLFFQSPGNEFRGHESEVQKVASAGRWTLWKMSGPRRDDAIAKPYPFTPFYD